MKKRVLIWTIVAALFTLMTSCDEKEDPIVPKPDRNWSENGGIKAADNLLFENNTIGNGDQQFVFIGKQTLKKGVYNLKGWVYIAEGAELTIEPGTVIKGDKQTKASLIVEPGGKLFAKGNLKEPIVFTSAQAAGQRKPGDWGGLVICGKAKNNQRKAQIEGGLRTKHGGDDDNDSSGVLSYIRIEFAGYPFEKDKEINGLTLGSVGRGTQMDHIQVSYSNDDSFEWFGGTVNAKYLVAYCGWDDDFDTDYGYSGKVQFGLSIRDPKIADTSRSNSFESDNAADGSSATPLTSVVFSNMTLIGPAVNDGFMNDKDHINGGQYFPNNGSALGLFQSGIQIRRNSRLSAFNSVILGWPIGLIIDNEKGNSRGNATDGSLALQNIVMSNIACLGSDANKQYKDKFVTGFNEKKKPIFDETQPSFSSSFFKKQPGNQVVDYKQLMLKAPEKLNIKMIPESGSPLLNAASFNHKLLSSDFDKVNFIGAFGPNENWLSGWTNFDPQNTNY